MGRDVVSYSRRRMIRMSGAVVAVTMLGGLAQRTIAEPVAARSQSSAKAMGAKGDGKSDDTAAIQRALDSVGVGGGVVVVEPGTYMVDASKSLRIRSNTSLQLADGAVLRCIPNGLPRYAIVCIENVTGVEVRGGQIEGDRAAHSGNDGEWGHGIAVLGSSHVTLAGTTISDCWGDGVYVGPSGGPSGKPSVQIAIDHVVSRNNRRQGLSLTAVHQVVVSNSTFTRTAGTAPACGIDIEPGKTASASDIKIESCDCSDNAGSGITVDGSVSTVSVTGSKVNGNKGYGLLVTSASDVTVRENQIESNALAGIKTRNAAK